MRRALAPGAESPALASAWAPLQEPAWLLTLQVALARGEAFPAARCEPALSMLAVIGAPETLAAKPVAAQEASALAGGGMAGGLFET